MPRAKGRTAGRAFTDRLRTLVRLRPLDPALFGRQLRVGAYAGSVVGVAIAVIGLLSIAK